MRRGGLRAFDTTSVVVPGPRVFSNYSCTFIFLQANPQMLVLAINWTAAEIRK